MGHTLSEMQCGTLIFGDASYPAILNLDNIMAISGMMRGMPSSRRIQLFIKPAMLTMSQILDTAKN